MAADVLDDCPMIAECPGFDTDLGRCLVRRGDCPFSPAGSEADRLAGPERRFESAAPPDDPVAGA
jgi:hypothetical protein